MPSVAITCPGQLFQVQGGKRGPKRPEIVVPYLRMLLAAILWQTSHAHRSWDNDSNVAPHPAERAAIGGN